MDNDERDDLMELIFRIFFAALRVECERLRETARHEPELKLPDRLSEAIAVDGVPERYARWVRTLAGKLEVFADSVRIAEHHKRPLGMRFPGERLRPKNDG